MRSNGFQIVHEFLESLLSFKVFCSALTVHIVDVSVRLHVDLAVFNVSSVGRPLIKWSTLVPITN
jgi:hypothetical protein